MNNWLSNVRGFGAWMPNYKFGFLCAVAALVLGLGLLAFGGEAIDRVMGAVVGLAGAGLLTVMPGWALDAAEEKEARRRAKEARRR